MSDIADELGFECYQMDNGIWMKRRPDGRRGLCVADEAVLWQALQAALAARDGKPLPGVDIKELVRENERLDREAKELQVANEAWRRDYERLAKECEAWREDHERLRSYNEELRANQRQKPGRKPRPRPDASIAGAPEALPAHEGDPLDEDL